MLIVTVHPLITRDNLDHVFEVLMYPTIVDVFTEDLLSARHLLATGDYL